MDVINLVDDDVEVKVEVGEDVDMIDAWITHLGQELGNVRLLEVDAAKVKAVFAGWGRVYVPSAEPSLLLPMLT